MEGAFSALDKAARSYYGTGDEPLRADEKYESHDGAVVVSALSVRKISAEVFLGLRVDTMVREAEGAKASDVLVVQEQKAEEWVALLEVIEGLASHIMVNGDGLFGVDRNEAASKALEACMGAARKARKARKSLAGARRRVTV
jgi:hypothetical protein